MYDTVFDKKNDKNAIVLGLDKLNYFFKYRVILFFGDWDGQEPISEASHHNEVHWFHNKYIPDYDGYSALRNYIGHIYSVRTREDLISTIKTIR